MVDPLGIMQGLGYAVQCLYDQVAKTKHNQEECDALKEYVRSVYEALHSREDIELPSTLRAQVEKLKRSLDDVSSLLEDLSKRPTIHRFFWAQEISNRIYAVYKELKHTMSIFNISGNIDLRILQQKSDRAREREHKRVLRKLEQNNANVLEQLGLHNVRMNQITDTMLALQKSIDKLGDTHTSERRVYRKGLRALKQHFKMGTTPIPDVFTLSQAEVHIHWAHKLGSGGFGEVYRGQWHGSAIAVKVLNPAVPEDLITREIEVWKRLRHPNILPFYGVAPMASPPLLVCALMTGDVMKYISTHPDVDRRKLLYDASCGLQYLHFHNIIHRDLKGANVLVDEYGRACLSDFGLAGIKIHTATLISLAKPATLFGSLQWIAPEQMSESKANKATDVYSFGMTIYEVYTGRPPFADTPAEILYTIVVKKHIRPPRNPQPETLNAITIEQDLWRLIKQTWSQHPHKRPEIDHVVRVLAHRHDGDIGRSRSPRLVQAAPCEEVFPIDHISDVSRDNALSQPGKVPPLVTGVAMDFRDEWLHELRRTTLLHPGDDSHIIRLLQQYFEDKVAFTRVMDRVIDLHPLQPNVSFDKSSLAIALSYWISKYHIQTHIDNRAGRCSLVVPPLVTGRMNKRMLLGQKDVSPLLREYWNACGCVDLPQRVLVVGYQWSVDNSDRLWRFVWFDLTHEKTTIYEPVCQHFSSIGQGRNTHSHHPPETPAVIPKWISLFRDCGWVPDVEHSVDGQPGFVYVKRIAVKHNKGRCADDIGSCLWKTHCKLLEIPA